jgi:hypothetical protein
MHKLEMAVASTNHSSAVAQINFSEMHNTKQW